MIPVALFTLGVVVGVVLTAGLAALVFHVGLLEARRVDAEMEWHS